MGNPVVVIGAGPAGTVSALLLARQGVRTLLLERHHHPYPLPRAVHLDDECVRVLQNAGVAADFARISRPAPGLRFLDADHQPLAEFRRSELTGAQGHPQANLFDQPELEALLLAAVAQNPLIELRRGTRVTGVDAVGRVHWSGGEIGAGGVIEAAAVVGCDGAGSLVRRSIGARERTLGRDQTWFVVDVFGEPPVRDWDGVEQICDPARPATYLRVGERRLRWEFRMRPGETAEGLTAVLDDLVRPWLPQGIGQRQIVRTTTYTFRAMVADRWRRGRVLIAGDAAHLTPPFIGQGLGSGLRDAANLGWKLARVLHGQAGDALLDTYQDERKPHVTAMVRLAVVAGGLMRVPTGGPVAALMRTAGRSQVLTRRILAGVSPPFRSGALTPSSRIPGRPRLVGTLFPQPPVPSPPNPATPSIMGEPAAGTCLDDLLEPGFALLVQPGAANHLQALATQLEAKVIRTDQPGFANVRRWLSDHATEAVLLRPDRVVLATAPGGPQARDPGVLGPV